MFIVGLTGGLATGKSTVLSIFRDSGIAVIDADQVAKQVLEPGTKGWKELIKHFGDSVLHEDGSVNRAALGEIIYNDIEKRKLLNAITHPKIQNEMMRIAVGHFLSGHQYIVMEVPLLFETGKMMSFMHKIITVTCDSDQQLDRLCLRNELSPEMAKKRIDCQMPLDYKVANSHFVIDNSGTVNATKEQTECIISVLRKSNYTTVLRAAILATVCSVLYAGFYFLVRSGSGDKAAR